MSVKTVTKKTKKRAKSLCAVPSSEIRKGLMGLTDRQIDEICKLADRLEHAVFGDAGAKKRVERRMKKLLTCVS